MRLLFIGSQGSGKSTQAEIIAKKLKLPHIQSGSLVRQFTQNDSSLAQKVKVSIARGELAPDELVAKLLKKRLSLPDVKNGFILDGYPRHKGQAELYMPEIDSVVYLVLPRPEAIRRLRLRKRSDDTDEAIKKRLDTFESLTRPLIDEYKKEHILHQIDATPSIPTVTRLITEAIK